MERLFRYLVAGSTLLFVILWLIPFVDSAWLTDVELDLLQARGHKSLIPDHPLIHWGFFTAWLVFSVGMFFFVQAARTAYVVLLALTAVAGPFWGYVVLTPIEATLTDIVAMSDGAIVVMAYLTPVDARFRVR